MIRGGAGLALAPRSYHVASAMLVSTQKRASLLYPFEYARLSGIERILRALRIACYAPLGGKSLIIVGPIPVTAPLPDVAGHVVEAVGRVSTPCLPVLSWAAEFC